ncbi:conjugal transfer protein TraH (plasmid) [Ensifer adhaerens]|uniref:conjugal transfer protein TraH n=1 Tax=Ensifer adhaerens TaxID=106592 RepID=UPI0023A9AE59|nr:conjugal transfer protein TraH [Ensifer adhaerens]WDZ81655.1 conjugal transfer protein TraH [Ensifer adhaerens]
MLEAAFIEKCADPSLDLNVVEAFVRAVGNGDPLAVTVKVGQKKILVEKAETPEQALAIARRYVGHAIVRVGMTSYPAHLGIESGTVLSPTLFNACENLRMGTAMFAKIMRIVAAWYGRNASDEALPYVLSDSLHAWGSGEFEGKDVFQAEDPGGLAAERAVRSQDSRNSDQPSLPSVDEAQPGDITSADMRIDLSGIGSNAPTVPVR